MDESNRRGEQALAVYAILITLAGRRATITYGQLAPFVEISLPRNVGRDALDPVNVYCMKNNWPPLTSLVVNGSTGEPGWDYGPNLYADRERVYSFNWAAQGLPRIADLVPEG